MKEYWDKALSFEDYMKVAQDRVQNPDEQDEHNDYYQLGLQRMERTLKTYKNQEDQLEKFKSKNFNGRFLMISEPWCGDASATVPAVSKFAEHAGVETRIFLRDSDISLIDQFLTNGTQSIPKILVLDENYDVKSVWGPRPEFGNELLEKFKADPEAYPREEFYNDLQVYYAKNRGRDAINELIELL